MKIQKESDLKKIADKTNAMLTSLEVRLQIGAATCGLAKRAHALRDALAAEAQKQKVKVVMS